MKDLGDTKTIIRWEITYGLLVETLKIDQKIYIKDLLESEEISSYKNWLKTIP